MERIITPIFESHDTMEQSEPFEPVEMNEALGSNERKELLTSDSSESTEESEPALASKPFVPVANLPPIADDADHVKTHFEILSVPTRKGQARYRCRKCLLEFECTGRNRLIQHIIGMPGRDRKNVRVCPDPHLPMKASLFKRNEELEIIKAEQAKILAKRSFEGSGSVIDFNSPASSSSVDEESSSVTGSNTPNNHSPSLTPDKSRSPVSSSFSQLPPFIQIGNPEARKRQRLNFDSNHQIIPENLRNVDRLMSIFNNVNQLSPQVLKIAVLLESLNDLPVNPLLQHLNQSNHEAKKPAIHPFMLPFLMGQLPPTASDGTPSTPPRSTTSSVASTPNLNTNLFNHGKAHA